MKITKIETIQIETPRYTGHISGHVIVKVHVDDGPVGLGEASDSRADNLSAITRRYNELLVGRDATRITEINEFLRAQDFGSTVTNLHLASAIDLALYDLNGKVQGVPLYQMLGGKMRDSVYCCYPTWGVQVREDFERTAGYLQRLVDLGHHLFRYYVSGDSTLDNDFLTEMKARFGDQIRLKQLDFSGRFNDWETALRYADVLRHHTPFHFEQPSSRPTGMCGIYQTDGSASESCTSTDLALGYEAAERGACTVFNVACVSGRTDPYPSSIRAGRIGRTQMFNWYGPRINAWHISTGPTRRFDAESHFPL